VTRGWRCDVARCRACVRIDQYLCRCKSEKASEACVRAYVCARARARACVRDPLKRQACDERLIRALSAEHRKAIAKSEDEKLGDVAKKTHVPWGCSDRHEWRGGGECSEEGAAAAVLAKLQEEREMEIQREILASVSPVAAPQVARDCTRASERTSGCYAGAGAHQGLVAPRALNVIEVEDVKPQEQMAGDVPDKMRQGGDTELQAAGLPPSPSAVPSECAPLSGEEKETDPAEAQAISADRERNGGDAGGSAEAQGEAKHKIEHLEMQNKMLHELLSALNTFQLGHVTSELGDVAAELARTGGIHVPGSGAADFKEARALQQPQARKTQTCSYNSLQLLDASPPCARPRLQRVRGLMPRLVEEGEADGTARGGVRPRETNRLMSVLGADEAQDRQAAAQAGRTSAGRNGTRAGLANFQGQENKHPNVGDEPQAWKGAVRTGKGDQENRAFGTGGIGRLREKQAETGCAPCGRASEPKGGSGKEMQMQGLLERARALLARGDQRL